MLLLFDIDGTLLQRAAGAHGEAIHEALRVVHGVRRPRRVETAGRTDADIARAILTAAGVPAARIDARADDVRSAACAAYARLCPDDLTACVTPGMGALLERLAAGARARLALVTGNFEPIARRKLGAAGIGAYFARGQGGFGSDHEDRCRLPAVARLRAGDGDGAPWPRERTLVIGDTPRDIACARADGVRVVAIATGAFAAEQLRAADHVVADAEQLGVHLDGLLADPATLPA